MRSRLAQLDQLRPYRVFDRPVFILAAPRSGSTYLFEIVSRFQDVWRWHAELDDIWWRHFPYDRSDEPSDYVAASECSPRTARHLRRDHYRYALWGREERGEGAGLSEKLGRRRVRFLDKTIANCFHLEVLDRVFPDAIYLFLVRDPRATISSMIEGWVDPQRFSKPALQPWLEGRAATIAHWSYPAPPGWPAVIDRPLEEICAWSWRRHVEAADAFLQTIPADRQLTIRYEQLTETPEPVVQAIQDRCGLLRTPELEAYLREQPFSRTTVSAPAAEKWRRLHGEEIERVLPTLEPLMAKYGYAATPIEEKAR